MKNFGKTDKGYILLVQIDFWFVKGKYDKVLECIDGLDKHLQGDPYLNVYRVNSYYLKKDFENTLKFAKAYVKNFEGDGNMYSIPFTLGIELKDHKKAAAGLKFMYDGEFFMEDLEENPEYKDFVNSDVYKKFKKENKHPNEK